ncbi:IS110 family transposase [Rhodococcus erythropolis]|nr:IS110 family transposase [Rhodococcus erythropolis]
MVESMAGFSPVLGAEVLAVTGGDLAAFGTPDRLARIAGLAPKPSDSGRESGNLWRQRRYDRRLLRAFYLAAQLSPLSCLRIANLLGLETIPLETSHPTRPLL